MEIDMEEKTWIYSVNDSNTDEPYAQYYNRKYGENLVVGELDAKIKKIIREMQRANILKYKRRIK